MARRVGDRPLLRAGIGPIFRAPFPCHRVLPDLLPCFPLPCQPRLFLSRLPSHPTSSFHRAPINDWYFNPPVPDRRLPCGRSSDSGDHVDDLPEGGQVTAVSPARRAPPTETARARFLGSAK